MLATRAADSVLGSLIAEILFWTGGIDARIEVAQINIYC
jgi:hypothetical protein